MMLILHLKKRRPQPKAGALHQHSAAGSKGARQYIEVWDGAYHLGGNTAEDGVMNSNFRITDWDS